MDEFLRQLAASGPIGLVAAIAAWVAWKKDQQLKELYERMLTQAEKDRALGRMLAGELGKTVNALTAFNTDTTDIEEDNGSR